MENLRPSLYTVACVYLYLKIYNWPHKTAKLTAAAYCTKPVVVYTGLQKYKYPWNRSTIDWNLLWKTNTKWHTIVNAHKNIQDFINIFKLKT